MDGDEVIPLSTQHTIGRSKVSITIFHKTKGDLLVSQHSGEGWFETDEQAAEALVAIIGAFTAVLNNMPVGNFKNATSGEKD